ncbi:MAG: calcium/sodium antiporter [Phycisphaerales bacterium]|nr:MAG: calcium/sodium antiporter [Phycisphaerales bacterium]
MNLCLACVLLGAGVVILWKGADLLVAGAVALAKRLGVSALVVGLTVVAMGTSAPEVAASIAAAVRGMGDTAIGNVYGSNIANLALVGGLVALIRPLEVRKLTLVREVPVMLGVALLLWPVLANLNLSRPEGLALLAVFATLVTLMVYVEKKRVKREAIENASEAALQSSENAAGRRGKGAGRNVLFILVGLAALALGADLAVRGAVVVGKRVGLSDAVIGLTIIAIGTSLPELATCVVAAVKGHHDISVGNLVGSNIFNTLLVTGVAGSVRPFGLEQRLVGIDYWVMIAVSVAFGVVALLCKRRIGRTGGILLVSGYVAYMVYVLGFSAGV